MINKINNLNLILGVIFFLLSLIFYFMPELDIEVTKLFYSVEKGFIYSNNIFVVFLFKTVPAITIIFAFTLIVLSIILYIKNKDNIKKISLYLTLVLSFALGAGLVTNTILKDNFGRARPKQIVEFGAQKKFSRVYEISDQCKKNCSFCSGHAAAAFSLVAIAFLVSQNYQVIVYSLGIFYGLLVGLGRIIQGGHFASDVFVSAWIVLIINYVLIKIYSYYRFKQNLLEEASNGIVNIS